LARLQHHLKYCATYGVFYQLVEDFEKKVPSNKIIKGVSETISAGIHVCRLGIIEKGGQVKWWVLGPAETATFNCNRYEEYKHDTISGNGPNNQSRHGADH
jgi:hypothetical protein